MNDDKIKEFRERLNKKKEEKEPWKVREWLALVISVIALAVAGTSTFYSTVIQREHMEGLILGSPSLRFAANQYRPAGSIKLLFTNRGNQSLTVTRVAVYFVQSATNTDGDIGKCNFDDDVGQERNTAIEPFVVKPQDVVLKTGTFDTKPFALVKLNYNNMYYIRGCVFVDFVTANGHNSHSAGLGYWEFPVSGVYEDGRKQPLDDLAIGGFERWPFTIINRWGTVFTPLE